MSVRLVYRNSRPEILEWAKDFSARSTANNDERWAWINAFYDAAGVPQTEDENSDTPSWRRWERTARMYSGGALAGLEWPREMDNKLPEGWFRPAKEDHLVRPRGGKKYKTQQDEFYRFRGLDMRSELQKKFGMHGRTFAGDGLYTCGIRIEEDAVWVMWGSLDVSQEKWVAGLAEHGWEQVPLVDYINAFGEEALR